ncbi:R3HC1 protein, partial [Daphoenositta chrysoptera]|nr:R3HC1 protein [Daphoenositta chrysoptera]
PAATLALRSMDGVFLSPSEDEFVGRIAEELRRFLEQGQHRRVLLFPPLSSRLRYLIHRTVENMELLSSFSVGEGWRRRTVICHSAVRLPNETTSDQKPGTNPPRSQRPAQPWGRGGRGLRPRHPGDIHGDNSRASVGSGRITRPPRKKPEKALYVPKGSRKTANWRERESPGAEPGGDAAPGGENRPKNSGGDTRRERGEDGGSWRQRREPGEEDVPGKGSAERPPCKEKGPSLGSSGDSREQERRDKDCSHSLSSGHNERPPEAGERDPSRKAPREEEEEEEEKEGSDVAEALWRGLDLAAGDREGTRQSRLEDDCTAELLAEVGLGEFWGKEGKEWLAGRRIPGILGWCRRGLSGRGNNALGSTQTPKNPSWGCWVLLGLHLCGHELKFLLFPCSESGFKIQWVDDTHALGIFSSLSTASQALGRRYPCLKIRPLIHATKQSKIKALQRPKLLHLGKERPQTDTAVARRFVSHALGWRNRQQEAAGTEFFQAESLEQQE